MSAPIHTRRVSFGVFEADLCSGELRKQGVKVKLHQQPFQVLVMLLEHPGEVVTRGELHRNLWPTDTFVDFDVGLNSAVRKLRDALQDSAESPRYVETLTRRGYRFIAPVTDLSTPKTEARRLVANAQTEEIPQPPAKVLSWARRNWIALALAGVAIGLIFWLAGIKVIERRQKLQATATPALIRAIAVLPLDNLSGDPGQDYFADGMTDALITDLAQISSLKVISRTSVIRYKGTRKPLPAIGKELGVDGIVEGTVIQSGERVRVDAQLIEASTDRHFWARTYERRLGDVITLQNEVARAIASEVQAKLTSNDEARLLRAESVDPQAYELYLKGRYFWNKGTDAAIHRSIEYFQQAIQIDPNYGLAYAGMADAYIVCLDLSPAEAFSRAKANARMGLQVDDGLAEAHNALAATLFWYDWDWAGAEKEFQRALALNPNYAQAHQWYGQYLRAMGWQSLAADEINRAHELDPLALEIGGGSGQYGTQYDLMIESNRKKLELDPNSPYPYLALGEAYTRKGMYQEAIVQLQKAIGLSGGAAEYLSALGYTYGVSGKRNEAVKMLQKLTLLSKHRYVAPSAIALVYVGLGEKDLAFDWLQKAVADRSIWIPLLKTNEEWESLRSDLRYAELLRQIGLPQ